MISTKYIMCLASSTGRYLTIIPDGHSTYHRGTIEATPEPKIVLILDCTLVTTYANNLLLLLSRCRQSQLNDGKSEEWTCVSEEDATIVFPSRVFHDVPVSGRVTTSSQSRFRASESTQLNACPGETDDRSPKENIISLLGAFSPSGDKVISIISQRVHAVSYPLGHIPTVLR
jgi:hypothetical protein